MRKKILRIDSHNLVKKKPTEGVFIMLSHVNLC